MRTAKIANRLLELDGKLCHSKTATQVSDYLQEEQQRTVYKIGHRWHFSDSIAKTRTAHDARTAHDQRKEWRTKQNQSEKRF